jgi:hypothetical protein
VKPKKRKPSKAKRLQTRLIPKKAKFLKFFRATCNVARSAELAGIDKSLHYKWKREDPKYAADFDASIAEAAGNLEDSAVDWAMKGIFEPLVFQGQFQFEQIPVLDPVTGLQATAADPVTGKKVRLFTPGERLGTWRRSEGLLGKLMSAWIPDK